MGGKKGRGIKIFTIILLVIFLLVTFLGGIASFISNGDDKKNSNVSIENTNGNPINPITN